jgi:lipopolysaccharide biosynthesis glycosyltransferase
VTLLHVSCAAEGEAYVAHSATMLHSVLAHCADDEVRVHYLHGPAFDRSHAQKLRGMIESHGGSVEFLRVPDADVARLPTTNQFTKAMWYRLFLPDLVPDADRVLYLDADAIAVDSLAPLWDIELGDKWLAAVTNVFQENHLQRPRELGLAGPEVYFNSGVLFLNLAAMRADGCTAAMLEYARSHVEIEWPDQDTLNVVLGARRVPLHPRWNLMNSMVRFPWAAKAFAPGALEEALEQPAIRHFEGPAQNKPWHFMSESSLRHAYFEHRRETPWPECPLEGATFGNALRRRLRRRPRASV